MQISSITSTDKNELDPTLPSPSPNYPSDFSSPVDMLAEMGIQESEAKDASDWRESNVHLQMLRKTMGILNERLIAFHKNPNGLLSDSVTALISDAMLQVNTIFNQIDLLLKPSDPLPKLEDQTAADVKSQSASHQFSLIDEEFVRAVEAGKLDVAKKLISLSNEIAASISYFQTHMSDPELYQDIRILIVNLSQLVLSFQKSMPKCAESLILRNQYINKLCQLTSSSQSSEFFNNIRAVLKALLALRDIDIDAQGSNGLYGHGYLHYVAAVPMAFADFANRISDFVKDDTSLLEALGSDQHTPLHEAVKAGHVNMVAWLRHAGITAEGVNVDNILDLSDKLESGYQLPLSIAISRIASSPYEQIIQLLLTKCSDMDTPPILKFYNQHGLNILQQIVAQGRFDLITTIVPLLPLAEFKTKIDSPTQKFSGIASITALHIAVELGFIKCIEILLAHGAAVDEKNRKRENVLQIIKRKREDSESCLSRVIKSPPQELLNILINQLQHAKVQLMNSGMAPDAVARFAQVLTESTAKVAQFTSGMVTVFDVQHNLHPELVQIFGLMNTFEQQIYQHAEELLKPKLADKLKLSLSTSGLKPAGKRMRATDLADAAAAPSRASSTSATMPSTADSAMSSQMDICDEQSAGKIGNENSVECKSEAYDSNGKRPRRHEMLAPILSAPNGNVSPDFSFLRNPNCTLFSLNLEARAQSAATPPGNFEISPTNNLVSDMNLS